MNAVPAKFPGETQQVLKIMIFPKQYSSVLEVMLYRKVSYSTKHRFTVKLLMI